MFSQYEQNTYTIFTDFMDPVLIFKLVELGAIMVPEDGQTHTNGFSKNLSIIQYNTPKAAT